VPSVRKKAQGKSLMLTGFFALAFVALLCFVCLAVSRE